MNSLNFWKLVRRYVVLIIMAAVAGGGIGAFMQLKDAEGYVATSRVFANSKRADNVAISQSTSLAVQRMESYIRLADSTRLADRVKARLGLNQSADGLASNVSASLDKDTVVMSLTVKAATADQAKRVVEVLPSEFTTLVNQLVDLPVNDPNATVFTTIDGPFVAKNSSATRLLASIIFGVGLGAAIGLAIASVRVSRLAGRTPQGLSDMTSAAVVGIIPGGDRGRHSPGKVTLAESRRLAYHRLARNLSQVTTTSHRLVVASCPDPHSSSTATVVGLARALAQRGDSVLVVDATFDGEGAATAFEVDPNALGLDAVRGSSSLSDAVTKTDVANLGLLQLGRSHEELLESGGGRKLTDLLDLARTQYDTIVVDASPVLARADLPMAVEIADCVVLVVNQFAAPTAETQAAVDGLRAMTAAPVALVLDEAVSGSMSEVQMEVGLVLVGEEAPDEAVAPR